MFGFVASTTSSDAVPLDAAQQLVDPQVLGLDAVERRERAAEHVVEPAVLVRPLERDEVDGLLDDADQRVVAPRVDADRAELLLGEVAALAAEADALLHVLDRGGERERLVLRHAQQVEREPLRRALADAGQAGQLRDEILDRGGLSTRAHCACPCGLPWPSASLASTAPSNRDPSRPAEAVLPARASSGAPPLLGRAPVTPSLRGREPPIAVDFDCVTRTERLVDAARTRSASARVLRVDRLRVDLDLGDLAGARSP